MYPGSDWEAGDALGVPYAVQEVCSGPPLHSECKMQSSRRYNMLTTVRVRHNKIAPVSNSTGILT
jgi:hypothetical protein